MHSIFNLSERGCCLCIVIYMTTWAVRKRWKLWRLFLSISSRTSLWGTTRCACPRGCRWCCWYSLLWEYFVSRPKQDPGEGKDPWRTAGNALRQAYMFFFTDAKNSSTFLFTPVSSVKLCLGHRQRLHVEIISLYVVGAEVCQRVSSFGATWDRKSVVLDQHQPLFELLARRSCLFQVVPPPFLSTGRKSLRVNSIGGSRT